MSAMLPDFDDLVSRLEKADRLRQRAINGGQQFGIGAIRHPNPDQLHRHSRPQNQAKKVFVLAHDDARLIRREGANVSVSGLRHPDVEDVNGIMALRRKPACESPRQLVIDDKPHVAWSTT